MQVTLDLPDELVVQLLQAAAARRMADVPVPAPDPQFTLPQVAEVLNLDVDTVRSYLKLETGHPRRLRYIDATGTAFGRRVLLSEITAWQARNLAQRPDELAATLTRPALRKAA